MTTLVGVQVSVFGLYLPPVFTAVEKSPPPQTIISVPVHTAVAPERPVGALVVLVAVHVSVLGLYRAPELRNALPV